MTHLYALRLYACVLAGLWAPPARHPSDAQRSTVTIWDCLSSAHYTTTVHRRIA